MPEIKIPGVYEIATSELMAAPSFVAGDVQISIGEAAFANTTNLPSIVVSGSPVLKLELTDAEFVASAIIKMDDQDDVWLGPTIYDLGSGDATEAKQDSIIAALAAGATIQSPVPNATTVELIAGDTYDGSSSPKLSWAVTKDYTGNTIKLVFTTADGSTTYKTATGAVESSTLVTVTMDAVFDSALTYSEGCQPVAQIAFALVSIDGDGDEETIARGQAYVYQRAAVA